MSKITRESVIHEFPDGRPHVTVDQRGDLHHYHSDGAELAAPGIKLEVRASVSVGRRSSGPAQVTTEAFRVGYDAIDWSKAN